MVLKQIEQVSNIITFSLESICRCRLSLCTPKRACTILSIHPVCKGLDCGNSIVRENLYYFCTDQG